MCQRNGMCLKYTILPPLLLTQISVLLPICSVLDKASQGRWHGV